jgi:hypothetical protein
MNLDSKLQVALKLGYKCEKCKLSEDEAELVYKYTDGLVMDRLERAINGHCSLAVSLGLDLEAEELRVDTDIKCMMGILDKNNIDYTNTLIVWSVQVI